MHTQISFAEECTIRSTARLKIPLSAEGRHAFCWRAPALPRFDRQHRPGPRRASSLVQSSALPLSASLMSQNRRIATRLCVSFNIGTQPRSFPTADLLEELAPNLPCSLEVPSAAGNVEASLCVGYSLLQIHVRFWEILG